MHSPFHTSYVRKPRFGDGPFRPNTRGDISSALKTSSSLSLVSPQSPRPAEMLAGYVFDSTGVDLSASDLAFNDLLISKAYEADPSMQCSSYEIPLAECLRFLGQDFRLSDVTASLRRMEKVRLSFNGTDGRDYKDVQMLTTWQAIRGAERTVSIGYQFADPIKALMRHMPRYGFVELAALGEGNMTSKYSNAVYKFLANEVAKRPWKSDADNNFVTPLSPEALADLVGFPRVDGIVQFAKLRERVISKIEDDLSAVRKFDVSITFDGKQTPARGRGKAVEQIEFNVTVNADYHRTTSGKRHMQPEVMEALKNVRFGAPDAPELRLDSSFWTRVVRKFKNLILMENTVHYVWIVALQEAIDLSPLSEGYQSRRFRGPKLLEAIAQRGVAEAAWQFFAEESAAGPDLVRHTRLSEVLPKAKRAQLERFRASKANAAAATVAIEPQVRETPIHVAEPSGPKPGAEVVPFEQCTHVELTVKDVSTTTFELDVLAKVKNIFWFNGPRRTLRFRYLSGGGYATLDLPIMLELEQDLLDELRICKADRFIEMNDIVYLKVTK